MPQVIAINQTNKKILFDNNYKTLPRDERIGDYIEEGSLNIIPEAVRNQLVVQRAFELNDEITDATNAIIILPTMMAQIEVVQNLFESVYLICNNQEFVRNLGNIVIHGAEVKRLIYFTKIELKELTEADIATVTFLKNLWNEGNPWLTIPEPLYFLSKTDFETFKRNLIV